MSYSAELYMHDLDRKAFAALNQFPKFVKLQEAYLANTNEKASKIELLSTGIRLSENQFLIYIWFNLRTNEILMLLREEQHNHFFVLHLSYLLFTKWKKSLRTKETTTANTLPNRRKLLLPVQVLLFQLNQFLTRLF